MKTISYAAGFVPITPTRPLPLAGFSGRSDAFAGIADELEANVVVLDDAGERTVLAALDLLFVGQHLRGSLEDALDDIVPPERLFLAASHTHFAPATDPSLPMLGITDRAYVAAITDRIADLVRRLLAGARKPLDIWQGRSAADNAVNRRSIGWRLTRRFPFFHHGVWMRPNLRGVKDETVRLLRLGDDALIWNYACHPVFMPQMDHVSSDYIGVVRQHMRRRLGVSAAVLFWQGFSGDVYPSFAVQVHRRSRSIRRRLLSRRTSIQPEAYRRWSDCLASCVADALDRSTPASGGAIRSRRTRCSLNDLLAGHASDKSLHAHSISIGPDVHILGVSAELVTAYAAGFRQLLRLSNLLCVACIDGVFGYVPTAAMLREGGYEAGQFMPAFSLHGAFRHDLEQVIAAKLLTPLAA